MVGGWATCVRFLRRKQGWSLLPRGIGQVMSVHTIKDTTQNRVCKHALGRERLRQAAGTLPWVVHVNVSQDVDLVLPLGKRLLKGLQARAPLLRAALIGGLSNTASGAGAWDDRN